MATDFERDLRAELMNLPKVSRLKPEAYPTVVLLPKDSVIPSKNSKDFKEIAKKACDKEIAEAEEELGGERKSRRVVVRLQ